MGSRWFSKPIIRKCDVFSAHHASMQVVECGKRIELAHLSHTSLSFLSSIAVGIHFISIFYYIFITLVQKSRCLSLNQTLLCCHVTHLCRESCLRSRSYTRCLNKTVLEKHVQSVLIHWHEMQCHGLCSLATLLFLHLNQWFWPPRALPVNTFKDKVQILFWNVDMKLFWPSYNTSTSSMKRNTCWTRRTSFTSIFGILRLQFFANTNL